MAKRTEFRILLAADGSSHARASVAAVMRGHGLTAYVYGRSPQDKCEVHINVRLFSRRWIAEQTSPSKTYDGRSH